MNYLRAKIEKSDKDQSVVITGSNGLSINIQSRKNAKRKTDTDQEIKIKVAKVDDKIVLLVYKGNNIVRIKD